MKYFIFIALCLSIYFFLRSLSFLIMYVNIYNYRVKMCIERIVKQQKACDLLNAVHQTFVMTVSMYLTIECIQRFFNMNFTTIFNLTSFVIITICYITYFILRFKMEKKLLPPTLLSRTSIILIILSKFLAMLYIQVRKLTI